MIKGQVLCTESQEAEMPGLTFDNVNPAFSAFESKPAFSTLLSSFLLSSLFR